MPLSNGVSRADMFAQYFVIVTGAFQTDRYGMRFDWMYYHYTNVYITVMPQLKDIIRVAGPGTGEHALDNVMWVQVFHPVEEAISKYLGGPDETGTRL